MAEEYLLGTYKYQYKLNEDFLQRLPDQLKNDTISPCGVLLELVMGKIIILNKHGEYLHDQSINFTRLPADFQNIDSYEEFNEVFNTDLLDEVCGNICNRFMIHDRKNNFVYEYIFNDLSQYFVVNSVSSCE